MVASVLASGIVHQFDAVNQLLSVAPVQVPVVAHVIVLTEVGLVPAHSPLPVTVSVNVPLPATDDGVNVGVKVVAPAEMLPEPVVEV